MWHVPLTSLVLFSTECFWVSTLPRKSSCQWLTIPSWSDGNLCLSPSTDTKGWGGEGRAFRCSCLDRMEPEPCVRVQPTSLRSRHSHIPFWGELFFPHLNFTLCVRGHPLVPGDQTGYSQGCVIVGCVFLTSVTGLDRDLSTIFPYLKE